MCVEYRNGKKSQHMKSLKHYNFEYMKRVKQQQDLEIMEEYEEILKMEKECINIYKNHQQQLKEILAMKMK